jgi:hypothetical protein
MKKLLLFLAGLVLAFPLIAESTRTWEQKAYEDFEKGTARRVSLRSDGRIQLAPRCRQLADPGLNYVWALAEDKRGNVYVAGGTPAKIVRIPPPRGARESQIKPETFFTGKELEIHALAVDGDNNVYAASSPDGKVYKITPDGQSSVFFDPKTKYVWALAFDPKGALLVATGDKGEIYRVERDGQGKLFYATGEAHARSLAVDPQGNIIVGTDPSGLILRLSPSAQAFILYQAPKKEVTALEVGAEGSIYAAVVGDRPKVPGAPGVPGPLVTQVIIAQAQAAAAMAAAGGAAVVGGTEVYRIFPDGEPRRLWSSKDEAVYALAARANSAVLLGSGNKGRMYQADAPDIFTSLIKAEAMQVTVLLAQRDGSLLAATSNPGKLLEIGNDYEAEGTFESEVFDARNFAQWGRVWWRGENAAGTAVSLYTRTGNVDDPGRNWSPWSAALTSPGAKSASPGARFIQWKAVLAGAKGQATPWLDTVEIAYLPKNLPPQIDVVEVTPAGYKFQATPAAATPPPVTITLPALGQPKAPPPVVVRFDAPSVMQQAKGWQGVRWAAHDDNDDTLVYSLYIRGKDERDWKLLKDKITEKSYSWDSTALPDGIYLAKVAASDAPSNTEGDALTNQQESSPFVIDNTPPEITNLKAAPSGNKLRVAFSAADALSPIKKAEYAMDGGDWKPVLPVGLLSDSQREEYSFEVEARPGEHTIAVRVYDRVENVAVAKTVVR